ncbi:FHA domain-containing protein [Litorihabitans aurantiacus]|uniref:FHA domain-containing protein n=1 Tax=Litorihabitans aurantiacus TaxID=1930061 RepID=A0AA37XD34_9MICO|nr:FHA domain-containing protein [Litorihabitans aurantiacus]GMA30961.1 hypothetical protein GCM10025875_09530 [Litorihabitans aurantiacus]
MTSHDAGAWSVYTPGPDSVVVTPGAVALLDHRVAADVVARVWEAARAGQGLAALVAPLVGSLADMPTFAVVVLDSGRARALVRGDVEVRAGGATISGQGVATWREETLTVTDGALEVVVARVAGAGAQESVVGEDLPLLAGVVRSSRATVTMSLPADDEAGAVADGAPGREDDVSGPVSVSDADAGSPVPAVVPVPAPVPADEEPRDVPVPDETADDEAAGDEPAEVEPVGDDVPDDQPGDDAPVAVAGEDEAVVEAPAESDTDDAADNADADAHDIEGTDEPTPDVTEESTEAAPVLPDAEPDTPNDTEPLLPPDPPLDVTLHPHQDESAYDGGYGVVNPGGAGVVPQRPEAAGAAGAPAVDRVPDGDPTGAAPSTDDAGATPLAPELVTGVSPAPAPSAPTPAPNAPPPVSPDLDDDGDHDGGTILDHQVAALREAGPGLVTVSPWAQPAAEPEAPRLRLAFSHGIDVELDRPVLVGRAPEARTGVDARLVVVPSPQQDISRTHCELRLDGEDVLVTDLRSTNGTVVARPGQVPHRLHPGEGTSASVGSRIDLGDGVVIVVER